MTQNPKETEKTVVLTLKIKADSMSELYGRIAEIVKSTENAADIESVVVQEKSKFTIHNSGNIRGGI